MSGVDVLAVIRRHAESHRAMAESDAYSAQEAPRLEAALESIAELIKRADAVQAHFTPERLREDPKGRALIVSMFAALAAVSPK